MPAMSKAKRGSGVWVSAFMSVRHYQPADLGPDCLVCKKPLVKALANKGMNTHPCCAEEDW